MKVTILLLKVFVKSFRFRTLPARAWVMKLRPGKLGSNDLGFKQLTFSFFQNLLEGSPLGDCEYQALLLLTGSP